MFIQTVNICTYSIRAPKFIKQILTDLEGRNKQQHNNSGGLQSPRFNNLQIIQTENQSGHIDWNYTQTTVSGNVNDTTSYRKEYEDASQKLKQNFTI